MKPSTALAIALPALLAFVGVGIFASLRTEQPLDPVQATIARDIWRANDQLLKLDAGILNTLDPTQRSDRLAQRTRLRVETCTKFGQLREENRAGELNGWALASGCSGARKPAGANG